VDISAKRDCWDARRPKRDIGVQHRLSSMSLERVPIEDPIVVHVHGSMIASGFHQELLSRPSESLS